MALSEPSSFNPYVPPQSGADDPRLSQRVRPRRAFLTWIYGALSAIVIVAIALTHVVEYSDSTAGLWELVKVLDGPFALVRCVVVFLWLHATWRDMPRGAREEVDVTPGKAVGFLFIPFLNFYWIFAMPRRLCTAIDRSLIETSQAASAPFGIALLAPALNVVHMILTKATEGLPVLFSFVATAALWFLFMLQCDRARAEILSARGAPATE